MIKINSNVVDRKPSVNDIPDTCECIRIDAQSFGRYASKIGVLTDFVITTLFGHWRVKVGRRRGRGGEALFTSGHSSLEVLLSFFPSCDSEDELWAQWRIQDFPIVSERYSPNQP